MTATKHKGSRRDVLVLLGRSDYIDALNAALAGTGTVVSAADYRRPINASHDREYEIPEFCRERLADRFDMHEVAEPVWWIIKRTPFVKTPNFDLISTAAVCGDPGLLLVEAKAHHGELETCGKLQRAGSNPDNHWKIGECIEQANRALNEITTGFKLSRDSFYQISNRVAWGWRLASLGIPVTLLYLGFLEDPYWPSDQFKTEKEWLKTAREYLGNVVPPEALDRRLLCSDKASLFISAAALPAVPNGTVGAQ